jgi:hypothetical protein
LLLLPVEPDDEAEEDLVEVEEERDDVLEDFEGFFDRDEEAAAE